MSHFVTASNQRPHFDPLLVKIADYVMDYQVSDKALAAARYCLIDSMGCAVLALTFPACKKLLGPWVSGIQIENGVRVPGTAFELDPIKAAFDIGTLVRWLDFNDTWLAKEWGHPSDNLGAILSVADFVSRRKSAHSNQTLTIKEVLDAMVRAYEIQGIMALENSFNQVGLDHVVLVKLASTAVALKLLGGSKEQIIHALSQVFVDGQALRAYRHAPNTGSRKSWAAGDATSRAVRLALLTLQGEEGYPSAITAKTWGFSEVSFRGQPLKLDHTLESYVIENILFKISFPAEFHAQTAVECAFKLHSKIKDKLHKIEKIQISTHQAAMRIINKTGPLYNPADRDHCLQYMVAIGLMKGYLTAECYEDQIARDPLIDQLRAKMVVFEEERFSCDYLDPNKRSIANQVEVYLQDGTVLKEICEYPIGHVRRREEGIPLLWEKFEKNLKRYFSDEKTAQLLSMIKHKDLLKMPVSNFMEQWKII